MRDARVANNNKKNHRWTFYEFDWCYIYMKNEMWAKAKTASSNDEKAMRAKANFFSFDTVYSKNTMRLKKRRNASIVPFLLILSLFGEWCTENNLNIYWICSMLFDWRKIKVANISSWWAAHRWYRQQQ